MTAWWKVNADLTRDPKIIAFAQHQVTLTDFIFTTVGVILILITGIFNANLMQMDYWHVRWLTWGMGLFIVSGVIWVIVLIPIQFKQAYLAKNFVEGKSIPADYWRLSKLWMIFGTVATILPLINLYWMVFKPS